LGNPRCDRRRGLLRLTFPKHSEGHQVTHIVDWTRDTLTPGIKAGLTMPRL
jgi:hypothetical protein